MSYCIVVWVKKDIAFLRVTLTALLGGTLYTPTLIEVTLGKTFADRGMSRGATVTWLMGQPYDSPKSLSAYRIVGWKIVATYDGLAFGFAVISERIYGLLVCGI